MICAFLRCAPALPESCSGPNRTPVTIRIVAVAVADDRRLGPGLGGAAEGVPTGETEAAKRNRAPNMGDP